MSPGPSGFQLAPGKRSHRLLRELLLAELWEERLRAWRGGAAVVFAAVSVLVFAIARWPGRFALALHEPILAGWMLSALHLLSVILLGWQARRRRERILHRMESRR